MQQGLYPPPPAPLQQVVVVTSTLPNNALIAGVALCAASVAATALLLGGSKLVKHQRGWRRQRARGRFAYDVFLSYRRVDCLVVDNVTDKLRQEGLRVFVDRSGDMSGRPFDRELLRALRGSACCSPVITLFAMTRLEAVRADALDFTLVEYVLALHLSLTGQLRLLYPLIVGEEVHDGEGSRPRRDVLWSNTAFRAARDGLPDIVPTATLSLADALLRAECGPAAALHPALAGATVRQLMCARNSDVGFTGLLMHDACLLVGLREDSDLYIRHRYAANIKTLVYGLRPSDSAQGVRARRAACTVPRVRGA